jgi:predicted DCC family thiol-disulfide oxidoreductase YuxK
MSRIFQTQSVLYDGGCAMCRRMLGLLRYLDVFGVMVPYDVTNDWARVQQQFPQLDATSCQRDMHVVTGSGQIYAGYDAWRSLAWALPLVWVLLPLLYLPPVRWAGWKIYRQIADNRCTNGCAIIRTAAPQHDRQVLSTPPQVDSSSVSRF